MFISPNLPTIVVGKKHLHLKSIDSTNDFLKRLKGEGKIAEGFTVTTDYQTSGRGQIGNTWEAEAGQNLLMSVFFKPKSVAAPEYFFLNMSVCLAIADTLNFFRKGFKVKWPNDILFERKKVAGVLIENGISSNALSYSIVGVGINVNQKGFTGSGFPHATSLSELCGDDVHLDFLLEILLQKMEQRYFWLSHKINRLKQEYMELLYGYGEKVEVKVGQNQMPAEILNVLPNGTLVVNLNGAKHEFQHREIQFVL